MYWVHRFGRGSVERNEIYLDEIELQATCYLLEERNCLTVGWKCYSTFTEDYQPNIVDAVEKGDFVSVKSLMLAKGINLGWARSLINFTKMKPGDIVVVLPYETESVNEYFIVEIKSGAKGILKSPANMIHPFTVSGFDFAFDSRAGWQYSHRGETTRLDVGFFHEVEVLVKDSPRNIMSDMFNYVRSTNAPVKDDNWRQKEIKSLIPK
ncbi:MAG: hypothetical protein IJG33_00800 [Selenomonadaceae bacterium]|nr:hypothetical protein [Selenomonadaceae bacterium]